MTVLDLPGDYATDVRPARAPSGRKSWAKDPTQAGGSDGTRIDATFVNDVLGLIRGTLAAFSIAATAGDDGALAQAIVAAVSGATSALAPIASPAFTGVPLAPTADPGNNTAQLATTAFVAAAIAALVNSAPSTLDTLKELSDALGDDANFAATITAALGGKLTKSSNLSDLTDVSAARTNLGLGTAAQQNLGTAAGNVVQVQTGGKLPALDGSQLTGLSSAPVSSVNGHTGAVTVSASDVGLGNCNNTSDASKPVSSAQQTALNAKMGAPDVIVQEQQASGTDGGSSTTGSRITRVLNALVRNNGSLASLSSNQVTLPAGNYYAEWRAPCYQAGASRTWLRNVTDSSDIEASPNAYADATYNGSSDAEGSSYFTLSAAKALSIQHQVSTAHATTGLGHACSLGTEIYSEVRIWKLS